MAHFDLLVIGSGPAGQHASIQAAKAGKKAALIEECPSLGGGCVHTGTLPSKSFRESVYRWSLGSRGILGQESQDEPKRQPIQVPDMGRLLHRKNRVVTMESIVVENKLSRNHVTILRGRGEFTGKNSVRVTALDGAKEEHTADKILIATGANPVAPSGVEVDGAVILDSNSVLTLKKVPKTMVVIGAGIIGCEYASMFLMAGTQVTLIDKRHEILASVDREIVQQLMAFFTNHGMEILLNVASYKIKRVKHAGEECAEIEMPGGRTLSVDCVLIAQGRIGNTKGLGLEKAGLQTDDRGLLKVNAHYQTDVPHIYACGDVIGFPALASTSMEQGRIACCHAFGIGEIRAMPENYPYGIYTIPEISTVGLTEEQVNAAQTPYVVGKAFYREIARGQIVGDHWGMLKLIVHRQTRKILGVHIIGDSAADIIHIGQAVMNFGGELQYFIHNVFNFPTLAEAYKTAAFHALNQLGAGKRAYEGT